MKQILHWILYGSLLPVLFHLIFRGKITGRHNIPRCGPLIVAANHASYLDPPILAYAVARPITFLAKYSLFRFPLLGWLLKITGCEPVRDHGLQLSLLRRAARKLLSGYVVAVFPTGTRTKAGVMRDPKDGVSYLSQITQTPVLPIALIGTGSVLAKGQLFPRFNQLEVRIGQVIMPPASIDRNFLRQHTSLVCDAISSLTNRS